MHAAGSGLRRCLDRSDIVLLPLCRFIVLVTVLVADFFSCFGGAERLSYKINGGGNQIDGE